MWRALFAGVLVSISCFAVLFYAAGQLMAILPRLESSPLFGPLVNAASSLAITVSGLMIYLKKRRRKAGLAQRREVRTF